MGYNRVLVSCGSLPDTTIHELDTDCRLLQAEYFVPISSPPPSQTTTITTTTNNTFTSDSSVCSAGALHLSDSFVICPSSQALSVVVSLAGSCLLRPAPLDRRCRATFCKANKTCRAVKDSSSGSCPPTTSCVNCIPIGKSVFFSCLCVCVCVCAL